MVGCYCRIFCRIIELRQGHRSWRILYFPTDRSPDRIFEFELLGAGGELVAVAQKPFRIGWRRFRATVKHTYDVASLDELGGDKSPDKAVPAD